MSQELQVLKREARDLTAKMDPIIRRAESEGRQLSAYEQRELQPMLDRGRVIRDRVFAIEGDSDIRSQIDGILGGGGRGSSWGSQFVNSDAYQWLRDSKNSRTGAWTSPSFELQAATLTSDAASGGDLIVPDYQAGITRLPTRRLKVEGLLGGGTTDSNLITYMKETTFTNAAAPVAEGGTKPESTLIFDAVSDKVEKIAHWLPVTDEMLEDVPQLRNYIDGRLREGVDLTTDDQLLNGSGTTPAIRGILNRVGLAAPVARGTDTNADAVLKQIAAITTATNIMPDGVVMHPTNWLAIQLLKDADGNYVSGAGPFTTQLRPTLWGLPVSLTPVIALGTALVGAFRTKAQVFRKGAIRVDVSNSHANFFVENKTAIRAERRLALVCYMPSTFGTVTGLL